MDIEVLGLNPARILRAIPIEYHHRDLRSSLRPIYERSQAPFALILRLGLRTGSSSERKPFA